MTAPQTPLSGRTRPDTAGSATAADPQRPARTAPGGSTTATGQGTPTKADQAAADRVLKRSVRKAVSLIRAGADPEPVLKAAVVAADVLLEGAA